MKKENAMRIATDETDFASVLRIISTHRSRALIFTSDFYRHYCAVTKMDAMFIPSVMLGI